MKKLLITFIMLGFVTVTNAQEGLKVSPVVKATATASGQKLQYPQTDKPEIDSVLIEIAPGGETGPHMHPVPAYVYVVEGTVTVEMDHGSPRQYAAGSVRGIREQLAQRQKSRARARKSPGGICVGRRQKESYPPRGSAEAVIWWREYRQKE